MYCSTDARGVSGLIRALSDRAAVFRSQSSLYGLTCRQTPWAACAQVARDFAEGAGGDPAAGARLAAASFDEVLFRGQLFGPPRGHPSGPLAPAGSPAHALGEPSAGLIDGEEAVAAALAGLTRAAARVGMPLPQGFAGTLAAAARDYAKGAGGNLAAGARIAAAAAAEALQRAALSRVGLRWQGLGPGLNNVAAAPGVGPAQAAAPPAVPSPAASRPERRAPMRAAAGDAAVRELQRPRRPCEHAAGGAAAQRWAVCFGEGPAAGGAQGPGSALCFAGNRYVWEARALHTSAPSLRPFLLEWHPFVAG